MLQHSMLTPSGMGRVQWRVCPMAALCVLPSPFMPWRGCGYVKLNPHPSYAPGPNTFCPENPPSSAHSFAGETPLSLCVHVEDHSPAWHASAAARRVARADKGRKEGCSGGGIQGGDKMEDLAGIPWVGICGLAMPPPHMPSPQVPHPRVPHMRYTSEPLLHPHTCRAGCDGPYSVQQRHSLALELRHCGPVPRIPVLNSFAGETPLFHYVCSL